MMLSPPDEREDGMRLALILALAVVIGAAPSKGADKTDAGEIPLYAGVAPGSEDAKQVEGRQTLGSQSVVVNVVRPTLTPVLPDKAKATGAAVVIAPGGAFKMLSIDSEGFNVARWLSDRGVAAFVLKYRLDPMPADPDAFKKDLAAVFARAAGAGGTVPSYPLPVADAKAAIRLVRQRAREWGVDPARVGLVGFSAGAITALQVALEDDAPSRPDFVASIYGPLNEVSPPADAPPLFVAFAADDPIFGHRGFGLVESWIKAHRAVELHMYEKGGHGFGMNQRGTSSDQWIDEFFWWMKSRRLLETPAPERGQAAP